MFISGRVFLINFVSSVKLYVMMKIGRKNNSNTLFCLHNVLFPKLDFKTVVHFVSMFCYSIGLVKKSQKSKNRAVRMKLYPFSHFFKSITSRIYFNVKKFLIFFFNFIAIHFKNFIIKLPFEVG